MSFNIPEFLNFLTREYTHIPVEANFKITIDRLFDKNGIIENLAAKEQEISPAGGILKVLSNKNLWPETVYQNQGTVLFANGVTIPGESANIARVGNENNGLHGGLLSLPILRGRKDLTNLEITFLETNASFIDSIVRPWVVATAQYGLFARDINSSQNFKTKVTITYLDKTSTNNEGRKIITFNDAAPVEVQGFETAYGTAGKGAEMRLAKTVWTYSTYSINYPSAFTSPVPALLRRPLTSP